mgnify:CR=1 FL=1
MIEFEMFRKSVFKYLICFKYGFFIFCPYSLMVKHGLGKTELPGQYRVRAPLLKIT